VGGLSANPSANEYAEAPPTPDPSPLRAARVEGGEKKQFADLAEGVISRHGGATAILIHHDLQVSPPSTTSSMPVM
jgi:hypothetical protein